MTNLKSRSYNPAQEGIDAAREDDRLAAQGLAYADPGRTVLRRIDGGTPLSLKEAIQNGGSFSVDRLNHVYMNVRDFLAQRIGAAILEADGSERERLEALWTSITGEKLS